MKLYGYAEGLQTEDIFPSELAEVTLSATPSELIQIAEFLTFCATEMERMGQIYDHIHLSDCLKEFRKSPHFVVTRSSD